MQSDTDLVIQLRDYMQSNPSHDFIDIKIRFSDVPQEKLLYILNEMLVV